MNFVCLFSVWQGVGGWIRLCCALPRHQLWKSTSIGCDTGMFLKPGKEISIIWQFIVHLSLCCDAWLGVTTYTPLRCDATTAGAEQKIGQSEMERQYVGWWCIWVTPVLYKSARDNNARHPSSTGCRIARCSVSWVERQGLSQCMTRIVTFHGSKELLLVVQLLAPNPSSYCLNCYFILVLLITASTWLVLKQSIEAPAEAKSKHRRSWPRFAAKVQKRSPDKRGARTIQPFAKQSCWKISTSQAYLAKS